MVGLKGIGHKGMTFVLRQTYNFKLILIRRVLHSIAMRLSSQYDSIYVTGLGADPVQLGSLRSVGNAVGANPVAFLVPCHRVIQQSGALGGYRWGQPRKQMIQVWERTRHADGMR